MQNLITTLRARAIPLLLLLIAAGLGVYSLTAVPDQPGKATGEAQIGGAFTMVNHKGETVTEKSFQGRYMLVFFGFTFCPDICPTTLQVVGSALDQLGAKGEKITPVLVSVDPARDTPEALKNYVENFHPRLVGLTGTPEQLAVTAKTFKVFYQKVDNPTRPQDYLMDHSSILYLMGPDGKFVKHFTYTTDAKKLAEGLLAAVP
jgi:cytochrome oxidase Cu insertion factor (SCO1/SenC/PrrC family)